MGPPQQKAHFNEAISIWIDFSLPLTHASQNNSIFLAIQDTRVEEEGEGGEAGGVKNYL